MNMKKFDAVCCADSAYGLFLYFLITGNGVDNTYFFFSKKVPKIYREQLQGNGTLMKLPGTKIRFVHYLVQLYYFIYIPFFYRKKRLNGLPVYGFDFMEWTNPIMSLSRDFYLIEDGFGNYTMPPLELERFYASWWRRILISKTNWFHLPFGLSKSVKKIYLTGLMPIPKEIEHKACVIDTKKIWQQIGEKRKQFFLDFFVGGWCLNLQSNREILLLTQCWSEAKIMSEEQKIDLYSRIILIYGEDNVVLKTHPRECTDYKALFPKLEVIDYAVPFQLLDLLGLHFKIAISVNSTAIFSLSDNTEKIILLPKEVPADDIYISAVEAVVRLENN